MFRTAWTNSGSSHTGSTQSRNVRAGSAVESTYLEAITSPPPSITPVTAASFTCPRTLPDALREGRPLRRAPRRVRANCFRGAGDVPRKGEELPRLHRNREGRVRGRALRRAQPEGLCDRRR